MKLFEVLNQAKATAEGISVDEAWNSLSVEIKQSTPEIQSVLDKDISPVESYLLYHKVLNNLKSTKRARAVKP